MSDVFREVDEDLRRERLKEFWNRYGILLLIAAVLVVVAVAVFVWLDTRGQQNAEAEGDRYYAALDLARAGDAAGAQTAFAAIAADGDGGYPLLAALGEATAMADAGNTTGAVAAFDAIANDNANTDAIRDVARIRAAMLLVDTASLDDIKTRLEPLTAEGASFRPLAFELMALTAIRVGDYDAAIGSLSSLVGDPNASQDAQARASRLFSLVLSRRGLTGATGDTTTPAAALGTPAVDLRAGADATAAPATTAPANELRIAPEAAPALGTPATGTAAGADTTLVPLTPGFGATPTLTPGGTLAPGAGF